MEERSGDPVQQERPPRAIDDFRRFFSRGLAALLPTLLTVAILVWAYKAIDQYVGQFITEAMVRVLAASGPPQIGNLEQDALHYGTPLNEWDSLGRRLTVEYKIANHPILANRNADEDLLKKAQHQRNIALWHVAFARYKLHLVGFVIAFIIVYFLGLFLASLMGRTTWRVIERLVYRIPVVRAVYPNVKQVTDFFLSDRTVQFSGVVAVQYPRKGIWSLGLVTGAPMRSVQRAHPDEMITVFIPSSPTPITGYVITVPKSDVIELGLTMDEAMRYAISAGVITPPRETIGSPESLTRTVSVKV